MTQPSPEYFQACAALNALIAKHGFDQVFMSVEALKSHPNGIIEAELRRAFILGFTARAQQTGEGREK